MYALAHGIPVYQPKSIRKECAALLRELAPELCVTAAFGQILSQELLDIPKYGCVNVHASLLPRHRGSAPINWAILQGDAETGVTTMMMARGVDTGDMLMAERVAIGPEETAGELTERLSRVGAALLDRTVRYLAEHGSLEALRTPQDEAQMTYDPKLEKDMGVVDWSRSAEEIVRQIHGLNPWPGASTAWQGGAFEAAARRDRRGNGARRGRFSPPTRGRA